MMKIPAGFHFHPTEEELINSYLRPKIMGQTLPCNIVEEKQLYAGNPWDVLHDGSQWMVSEINKDKTIKRTIYIFTKLTKKAATGKLRKHGDQKVGKEQFVRAAGCGTWDGQTGPREIKNGNGNGNGELIGYMKMLVFEMRDINPINMGHYIMHEYSLPDGESDYVLCEIIHDSNKRSKRKRGVVEEADEIVPSPKRLTAMGEGKKDEEEIVTSSCCVDVPVLVHDHEGGGSYSSSAGMEYSQWSMPMAAQGNQVFPPVGNSETITAINEIALSQIEKHLLDDSEVECLDHGNKLLESINSMHSVLQQELNFNASANAYANANDSPSSGMEYSQVLPPAAVEYPNELMPIPEFEEQTSEWELSDLVELGELLDLDHEVGPSCMEYSQVLPPAVEYPNELMPIPEFEEQTSEWELSDLVELGKLLDLDHEVGPSCMEYSQAPFVVEYPIAGVDELTSGIEFQQHTHEWRECLV